MSRPIKRSSGLLSLLACTVFAYAILIGTFSIAQEKGGPLIPTRHGQFVIPFAIKSDGLEDPPDEIELLYSNDQGTNWFPYGRVKPEKGQFFFNAPTDGEYWFLFKTYTRDGLVNPNYRRNPLLRVLVDTIPPHLTTQLEQRSTGELVLTWSIEDANLLRRYPKVIVAYDNLSTTIATDSGKDAWKEIAVDPNFIRTEGAKNSGELVWWAERNAKTVEVRVEVIDIAGNRELQSRTIRLMKSNRNPEEGSLTEEMQRSIDEVKSKMFPPTPRNAEVDLAGWESNQPEKELITQTNNSIPLSPPKPQSVIHPSRKEKQPLALGLQSTVSNQAGSQSTGSGNSSQQVIRFSTLPAENARPLSLSEMNSLLNAHATASKVPSDEFEGVEAVVAPMFANEVSLDDSDDPMLISNILGSKDTVTSNRTNLLGISVAASPLLLAETGNDTELNSEPVPVVATTPPIPKQQPDLPERPQTKGDSELDLPSSVPPAQMYNTNPKYGVADSPPVPQSDTPYIQPAKITKVSLTLEAKPPRVVVKWEIGDRTWAPAKVHVFRGLSLQGPWTPIATDLNNTGVYGWPVSFADRDPFFVLVQCQRSADDVMSDITAQPILLPSSLFND